MGEASGQTGLDDFGDDSFREGLEILLAALRDEARLNDRGEAVLHRASSGICQAAAGRGLVPAAPRDRRRAHRGAADRSEPAADGIDRPVVLLAQDPDIRYLRQWESSQPCPPPVDGAGPDPRIPRRRARWSAPATTSRPITHGPMECLDLMALDFKTQMYHAFARIPSYSAWVTDADLTSDLPVRAPGAEAAAVGRAADGRGA